MIFLAEFVWDLAWFRVSLGLVAFLRTGLGASFAVYLRPLVGDYLGLFGLALAQQPPSQPANQATNTRKRTLTTAELTLKVRSGSSGLCQDVPEVASRPKQLSWGLY